MNILIIYLSVLNSRNVFEIQMLSFTLFATLKPTLFYLCVSASGPENGRSQTSKEKQANTSIQTLFQASAHPVAADVLLIIDLRM